MEMDRLSALPDCLLLRILHRLGLKKAAQTAVLSKQWRFLWKNWPFSFCEKSKKAKKTRRFVAAVDAVLAHPRDPPLHTLDVSFYYDVQFASDVDRWLDFAAKNKLKSLSLRLKCNSSTYLPHPQPPHTLPQITYTNSSLKRLHLEGCTMIPPRQTAVDWRCLRWLFLWLVKSSQRAIDKIVSGCPLLETLEFEHCDGIKRLEIGGRRFRSLTVAFCGGSDLKAISAPYMRDLSITVFFGGPRIRLRLENVQSLESAAICLCRGYNLDNDISADKAKFYIMKLFKDLHHVKHLELEDGM